MCIVVDMFTAVVGGAERQIVELCQRLDKNKFRLIVACLSNRNSLLKEMGQQGIETYSLNIKRIYSLGGVIKGFRFSKALRERNVDIVMTYHFGSDIWGTVCGKMAGVPIIISNRRDMGFWRNHKHIFAYKIINRWVNRIIVVSNAVKRIVLEEERVPGQKTELLFNGIDLQRFNETPIGFNIKEGLSLPNNSQVIGCVGNLRPVKGIEFLLNAAKLIIEDFPNAHFLLIGSGELKGNLVTKTQELGIQNNIHFLGLRRDVTDLLRIMDICVLPSLSEGMSNALLEYMAAGKPVVATAVGGNTDVIEHEKNGVLVPPKDPEALATQIIRLLKDIVLAARLGNEARKTVENKFNINKQITRLEDFLDKLITEKRQKKVLHLISSNGLFGAEKVMLNLAVGTNTNDYRPWVAALRSTHNPHIEVIEEATKQGVSTFIVDSRGRIDLGAVTKLARFIRENNIALLHTHNYKSNLIGLLAAKRAGIPAVATVHGYIGSDRKARFYEALDRFILRYFDKVILVDKSLQRWFPNGNGKYTIINNGVGSIEIASSFAYGETPRNDRLSSITIGTVGRLSEEKGHKYLIEAFAKLSKEYPIARLLIVGEGTLHNELKNLTIKLNIADKVTFTGYQNDVSPYYDSMDIYVSSSLIEHFPVSILEAMAAGKAVIATNAGGTTDLIKDGETGLLVETNSADVIYTALLKLIDNTSLRDKLAVSAKRYVAQNYSLDKMIDQYQKVYAEVSRGRE